MYVSPTYPASNLTDKRLTYYALSWLLLPIAIYSVLPFYRHNAAFLAAVNNTTFWWIINTGILFVLFSSTKYLYNSYEKKDFTLVKAFLIYISLQFVHGLFVAKIYWDWKSLIGNTLALLLPLAAYTAANPRLTHLLFQNYFKYTIILFFPIAVLIRNGGFGYFLVPITLLIFFLPVLTKKWRLVVLFFSAAVFLAALTSRSNIIRFGIPFLLLSVYYARHLITRHFLNVFRLILFIAPIVLFVLAVTNIFNVFKIDEYLQGNYIETSQNAEGELVEENLMQDTRTFLYMEVLATAKKYNTWVFGRSPARGNETEWFASWALENYGRAERPANEVAILNIFTWTGIIGVVLYALVFYRASYLAINKSNNIFIKIIGIYMAFRWLYAWIEDINNFSLNYLLIWVGLGMCYSKAFRTMNDLQMKYWVRGIFDVRYVGLLGAYTQYLQQRKKTKYEKTKTA
jgi:O-Antigen ligase.